MSNFINIFFIILLFFYCVYCQSIDNMVNRKKPLEFASDIYGGKIGETLQMVVMCHHEFTGDATVLKNNVKLMSLQKPYARSNITVFREKFNYVLIIKTIEAESAGLYSLEYEEQDEEETTYSAKPFTIVIVLEDPTCSAHLVKISNDTSTLITKESVVNEGQMMMLKCTTKFYSDLNTVQPFRGWRGVGPRMMKQTLKENGEKIKSDLYLFSNDHEVNITLSYDTNFNEIQCVTEWMSAHKGSTLNEKTPKMASKVPASKVFCKIPAPKLHHCPLHVKVEETRLENGSKNLKCHAEGNPGPVYVWQSTNNYFKPVIANTILVDLPGYYTCTARTSMKSKNLQCHPQIAVHGISISNSNRPSLLFIVLISTSIAIGIVGIIFLLIAKNQLDNRVAPTTIRNLFGGRGF